MATHPCFAPRVLAPLVTLAALAAPSHAGDPQRLDIIFVADPLLDRVYELRDWNLNGTWGDAPDCEVLYESTQGAELLVEPVAVTADPDDAVYVGDAARDVVLYMNDLDGDGDLNDAGEASVYFNGAAGGNASGVRMARVRNLDLAFLGIVWAAASKDASEGSESILRFEDLNADGDANDAGEALAYHERTDSTSVVTALCLGLDNFVYFVDNGLGAQRGVWKLIDLNGDGDAQDAGEAQIFWSAPTSDASAEFTTLDQDETGAFYLGDRAGRRVLRLRDDNADGLVQGAEASVYWILDPLTQFMDFGVSKAGAVYLPDNRATMRILQAVDLDASLGIASNEVQVGHDDLASTVDIGEAASVAMDFHGHEEVGVPFCDGTSGLCPCGNNGAPGRGCINSTGSGAGLEGAETDGITNDDLELTVYNVRAGSSVLLFSGSATVGGGFGTPFGDGLRCVGGSVSRLGVQFADATGSVTFGPGLAAQNGWQVGQTVYFQGWYRNVAGPCSGGFNLTNGLQVTFTQ